MKDKLATVANLFKRGVIKLQIFLATHIHTYSLPGFTFLLKRGVIKLHIFLATHSYMSGSLLRFTHFLQRGIIKLQIFLATHTHTYSLPGFTFFFKGSNKITDISGYTHSYICIAFKGLRFSSNLG